MANMDRRDARHAERQRRDTDVAIVASFNARR